MGLGPSGAQGRGVKKFNALTSGFGLPMESVNVKKNN